VCCGHSVCLAGARQDFSARGAFGLMFRVNFVHGDCEFQSSGSFILREGRHCMRCASMLLGDWFRGAGACGVVQGSVDAFSDECQDGFHFGHKNLNCICDSDIVRCLHSAGGGRVSVVKVVMECIDAFSGSFVSLGRELVLRVCTGI
jgi:hypothetical protein